jgi:hypothetical protein
MGNQTYLIPRKAKRIIINARQSMYVDGAVSEQVPDLEASQVRTHG